jgi:hypothetical protein
LVWQKLFVLGCCELAADLLASGDQDLIARAKVMQENLAEFGYTMG